MKTTIRKYTSFCTIHYRTTSIHNLVSESLAVRCKKTKSFSCPVQKSPFHMKISTKTVCQRNSDYFWIRVSDVAKFFGGLALLHYVIKGALNCTSSARTDSPCSSKMRTVSWLKDCRGLSSKNQSFTA